MSGAPRRIRPVAPGTEVAECARLMAGTEPWITLGRTFESSLRNLQDAAKEVYVMDDAGGILGFVVIDMRGPFPGYIQTVCVRPDARGRGHGTALIAWAEQRIFRDSPNAFMCVSSFNPDAQRLYARLGYAVVGELADYLVRGHGEILLRKTRGPWAEFARP